MNISVQNIFYVFASIAIGVTALILGENLLSPLVFAILFAIMLSPLCNTFEKWGFGRVLAILMVFLSVIVAISVVIILFSVTFANIYEELPEIRDKIEEGTSTLNENLNNWTGYSEERIENEIEQNKSKVLAPIWNFIETSISTSFITVGNFFLAILYIFMLLYYRKGIKEVFLNGRSAETQKDRKELIGEVQDVISNYALSMLIVILVLGSINSLGLWIIGIDYPLFWGFLAGILVIIPYIGTTLGGLFPFLYALATTDTMWQPVAILIMYFVVQQIEGNFITPNIVGSKINVNALTVILAMILGGLIWGLSGLILALPIIAVLRTVLIRYEATNSIAMLMSSGLGKK